MLSTDVTTDNIPVFSITEESNTFISFPTIYQPQDTTESAVFVQTKSSDFIVSTELYLYIQTIVDTWTVTFISILGIVTNILNIIVFSRQGFPDGINISLTSITIWDLIKCLGSLIHRVYGPIRMIYPAIGTSWRNMTFPVMTYLPLFCSYVAYALATYVGLERCLSVAVPLKVKSLFTPKCALILNILISVVVFGAFSVMFFIYDVVYVYSSVTNTTSAVYVYNSFYFAHEKAVMVYYKCIGLCLPICTCSILGVTSSLTVHHLKKHSNSLNRVPTTHVCTEDSVRPANRISRRDKRVARTLLVVIVIYMINILPRIPVYIAALIEPDFYILKRYNNLFMITVYLIYILDYINASSSFFIFIKMSTNFKATFFAVFSFRKRKC